MGDSLVWRILLMIVHQGRVMYVRLTFRGMQPARFVSFQLWRTCVYPLIVHTGLVVPSSSWSLRSPAVISMADWSHLSRLSVSEGCLVLGRLLTPPFSQLSRLALGSLDLLW